MLQVARYICISIMMIKNMAKQFGDHNIYLLLNIISNSFKTSLKHIVLFIILIKTLFITVDSFLIGKLLYI